MTAVNAVGEHLRQICEQFEDADRRAHVAAVRGDVDGRASAEWERLEAEGEHQAAALQLADLGLLLIRYVRQYRPDALRGYLAEMVREIMAPEIEALADAVVKLEGRRR